MRSVSPEYRGKLPEARSALLQAVDRYQQAGAGKAYGCVRTLNNLALVRRAEGNAVEALSAAGKALAVLEQQGKHNDPEAATSMAVLGLVKLSQGRLEEAERLLEASLSIRRSTLGARHPQVAESLSALGLLRFVAGSHAASAAGFRSALDIQQEAYGKDDARSFKTLKNLARVLQEVDLQQALNVYADGYVMLRRACLHEPAIARRFLEEYAMALNRAGDSLRSRAVLAEADATGPVRSAKSPGRRDAE